MKYRVAVVDDDKEYASVLKEYIASYGEETGTQIETCVFQSAERLIMDYKYDFDIIFFDIVMAGIDGIKAAELLRKTDKNVVIIFVTNFSDFAINGYAVNASGYLLKPVKYQAFKNEMNRGLESVRMSRNGSIVVTTEGEKLRIPVRDILYIEHLRHRLYIVVSDGGRYTVYDTLNNMEEKLKPYGFCRCNSCYLVNLLYVEKAGKLTVTVGNRELPISRSRLKSFMEELAVYFAM